MSYRNKTYVIFDGDNDIWAYGYMKGWKSNENMEFNFSDAHDLNTITDRASEETVKRKLRERISNAKQVIVLVGASTKNLFKFVRWEIEIALALDLPIVAANLNKRRTYDEELCPPILKNRYIVHVSFNARIIQYALDNFPQEYRSRELDALGNRSYSSKTYEKLRL